MRSALALVALLLGVATSSTSALGAESTASAGPRVTIFGDSVADSLSYVPDARQLLGEGLDLRLELAPCRKLVPQGCVYRGERPPSVLDIVKTSSLSQLGNIVIVAVGYNDPANNYETDMAQVAIALVDLGVAHVIWLTLREQTDDYRQINAAIRDQARRWPQVQIADWENASRGKDWFNADGLHLNADGAIGTGDPDPALRARGLRIGVQCGHAEGAAERAPADAARAPRLSAASSRADPARGQAPARSSSPTAGFAERRCIARVIGNSRRLGRADAGRSVSCRVWAGNANGATAATSKAVQIRASG